MTGNSFLFLFFFVEFNGVALAIEKSAKRLYATRAANTHYLNVVLVSCIWWLVCASVRIVHDTFFVVRPTVRPSLRVYFDSSSMFIIKLYAACIQLKFQNGFLCAFNLCVDPSSAENIFNSFSFFYFTILRLFCILMIADLQPLRWWYTHQAPTNKEKTKKQRKKCVMNLFFNSFRCIAVESHRSECDGCYLSREPWAVSRHRQHKVQWIKTIVFSFRFRNDSHMH